MRRPPLTSRNRQARDALAAVILEAFETSAAVGLLEDLRAVLTGEDRRLEGACAACLERYPLLVRVTTPGVFVPADGVVPGPLVERLQCASQAMAAHRRCPSPLARPLADAAALLAAGLFFEVHEVLEREWRTLTGTRRRLYQGVIQLSVALHHLLHQKGASAVRLFGAARGKLSPLVPCFAQVDVARLLAGSEPWEHWAAAGKEAWPDALELPVLTSCDGVRRREHE